MLLQRDRLALPAGVLALCALALALASCGSSGTPTTTRTASTASQPLETGKAAGGSSLKVTGTPKFASPSPSAPVRTGTVQVAYRNITISPNTLRVKAGTTVRWTNFDTIDHNVTTLSGPQRFASKDFGAGQSFQIELTRPGTIHYECTIHPATMNGTIEVLR